MTCIEIDTPLSVVNDLFHDAVKDNAFSELDSRVQDHFKRTFKEHSDLKKIPSLNTTPLRRLKPNTLVRFRCMIQDQQDPEYYVAATQMVSKRTGERNWVTSMYTDYCAPTTMDDADCVVDERSHQFREKQLYHCVSIPGETSWAKEAWERKMAGSDRRDNVDDVISQTNDLSISENEANDVDLPSCTYLASKYPFPENHTAALVKVYDKNETLKVTEEVEFYGILGSARDPRETAEDDMMGDLAVLPPPSSLPFLHVIFYHKLKSSRNAVSPAVATLDEAAAASAQERVRSNAETTREHLLNRIAHVFGGDTLVAEFVLLQLLSRVYARKSDAILGNMTLNIANVPVATKPEDENGVAGKVGKATLSKFGDSVSQFLQTLLSKSYHIPLSVQYLNEKAIYPKSEADVLKAGVLQVTEGTWLVVDETVMEEGDLNDQGVRNIQALKNVMECQTLHYAFPYSTIEVKTAIGFIVLSNSKSLLSVESMVPMTDDAARQSSTCRLDDNGLINDLDATSYREYISILRHSECFISDEMATHIQEDFVRQRKEAFERQTEPMTDVDFAFRIGLARLVSISRGRTQVTAESWAHASRLDEERKTRVQKFSMATAAKCPGANGTAAGTREVPAR